MPEIRKLAVNTTRKHTKEAGIVALVGLLAFNVYKLFFFFNRHYVLE